MNWLALQTLAQISVERILNALPEGFLIVLFVWALLRVLRGQNSGTRFAVWFLALMTVAILPVLNIFGHGQASLLGTMSRASADWRTGSMEPAITIPERWAVLVFLVWVLGAGIAMVRLASGLWRLRQLRQSCTAIAVADLDPLVRITVETITASGSVAVTTSDCVRVPAAIGFWKRTIILPAWTLSELPPADLKVILLHEFAHLRRGDDWTNLIQKMVRALFFFHPAVWWIESELSVEREMACDDAVLAETANPHGYATCLVSLLEKSLAHRGLSLAQAAVHRAREASLRLTRILDKNRPAATRVWKPALAMVGAFAVLCLMALSQAPRLVAVDRAPAVSSPRHEYATAIHPPALPASPIPATVTPVKTGRSLSLPTAMLTGTRGKNGSRVSAAQPIPVEAVAQTNAAATADRFVTVNANTDLEVAPQFQTLVLIQATQFGNPALPVWRVQVWQVMVLRGAQEKPARVPVAHSI